jgi:hypothetical protein
MGITIMVPDMQLVVVSDHNVLLRDLASLAPFHPPPSRILTVYLDALVMSHL